MPGSDFSFTLMARPDHSPNGESSRSPAEWNFADVWEAVATAAPTAPAQVHGARRCDYAAFSRRADGIAARLLAAGLERHDKVALYLYNTPEYLETAFAAMKAALVPVNTNYRYRLSACVPPCTIPTRMASIKK